MSVLAVPADVVQALAARGLTPTGSTGAGRGWVGRRADGAAFELVVVGAVLDDALATRARLLCGLRHDHVVVVHELVELAVGRLGLLVDHVAGSTFAALMRARVPLSDAEAATVAIPLAQALEALHALGLAHGALTGEDVVLTADGRPMLVGVRPCLLGGADPDDDVPRLLATVLDAMPGADLDLLAWSDDDGPRLRPVLDDLLATPQVTGVQVCAGCFATVVPEPVRLPDPGTLAGALVAGAVDDGAHARPTRRGRPGADPVVVGRRAARRTAARRVRPATLIGVAVGCALLVVGAGAVASAVGGREGTPAQAVSSESSTGGPSSASSPTDPAGDGHTGGTPDDIAAVSDLTDPVTAAAALTRLRAATLAAGDAAALTGIDVPEGPAHAADAALLAGLGAAGARGLAAQVVAAAVVPGSQADQGVARVSVTAAMSGYTRDGPDGPQAVPPTAARTVVLEVRRTPQGWRVWSVSETAAGT